ncbi:putative F-box domain-containing protein [Helianthus annuus]|nr:putative F-box domain-containing protein [Helianthus annuus]KAJ0916911.1 putative F-box domain-containing protein [Helianthus annuus]
MSDNVPFEIQEEIIKRLPIKSLIRFQLVSKAWKSLICSRHFIADYSAPHPQLQHLLVRYDHGHISTPIYSSVIDDHTLLNRRVSLTPPPLVNWLRDSVIIGSSHGLLCLQCFYGDDDRFGLGTRMAVIWNISIRKAIAVVVPNVPDGEIYITFTSFGVCPETSDPKIVKITEINKWSDAESVTLIPWQVEVFTVSSGVWRCPYSTNLPRKSVQFSCSQVVVDGFCYWLATDRSTIDPGFKAYNLIISFHMTREEFIEVNLPDSLIYEGSVDYLNISNLRESLVVLDRNTEENVCYVWSMKDDGVSKSFTKLFTIYSPDATLLSVLEFRRSGEPVIEILDNDADPRYVPYAPSLLAIYEPKSKHISNLGINGIGSFFVHSYKETLLLLDQPDFTVYDKGKGYIVKQRAEILSLLKHTNKVEMQGAHEMK